VGHGHGRVDAEQDQGGRHQSTTTHTGHSDHDADAEANDEDREGGGGEDVGHQRRFPVRAGTMVLSRETIRSMPVDISAPRRYGVRLPAGDNSTTGRPSVARSIPLGDSVTRMQRSAGWVWLNGRDVAHSRSWSMP